MDVHHSHPKNMCFFGVLIHPHLGYWWNKSSNFSKKCGPRDPGGPLNLSWMPATPPSRRNVMGQIRPPQNKVREGDLRGVFDVVFTWWVGMFSEGKTHSEIMVLKGEQAREPGILDPGEWWGHQCHRWWPQDFPPEVIPKTRGVIRFGTQITPGPDGRLLRICDWAGCRCLGV